MKITDDIKYIGVNDHEIDLFEGHYIVPEGMAYNSYLIRDDKVAVMDSVDEGFAEEWIGNIKKELGSKEPDYIIVQHMEPDHSGSLKAFMEEFKSTTVAASQKAFTMMANFLEGECFEERSLVVKEGDTLELGSHSLSFIAAPMVHWPEVIMTYDAGDKVLFSADAFGRFGALDVIGETVKEDDDWACEARRYYFGIVGKYGAQTQAVLKKAASLDIEQICSLHGPVINEDISYYLDIYDTWSAYESESQGVVIAYTSVYGHTKKAVEMLAEKLKALGVPRVVLTDLARDDMAEAVEDAFRHDAVVFATTTFNNDVFPYMREFIHSLVERNFQKKRVAFIENGSWAPAAGKVMKAMLEGCKDLTYAANEVKIVSALNDESRAQLEALAEELAAHY